MTWLLRLVARVPLPMLHSAGASLGWLIYLISARYRRYLRNHLELAGYPDAAMRRATVAETGKTLIELPAIWLRSHRDSAAMVVSVHGWEWVERAMRDKRGLIVLTPHFGCWEIAGQYFSWHYPMTVMYRPPKVGALAPLMEAGRNRDTMKSVPADLSGVRALYRALRRGESIGMLPDQVPGGGEGEWTSFFGRPAYTMTLAMRIAESSGAPVLLTYAERLGSGRGYGLHVEPLPEALPGETPPRRMNRALEALIRRIPAQYLWAYNRYKVPAGVNPPQDGA
jgi:KDO2-lipid IV(A) lauroyltransferase